MLELNKIYCGDCLDLMREMPDKCVDLIVTSPPYNICVEYEGNDEYTLKKQKYVNPSSDIRSDEEYVAWLNLVIKECIRVSRYVCWNVQWLRSTRTHVASIHSNFDTNLKEVFIWKKQAAASINWKNGGLARGWEYVFMLGDENTCTFPYNNFPPNGYIPNIQNWVKKDISVDNHHARFPLVLPSYFISNFTKENDIVLDPFNGSGTSCIASRKLGRNYIGMDKEPIYVDQATKALLRVNNHKITDFFGVAP
jgi:site-specific DNA-methyltransferase (adenine-specific)